MASIDIYEANALEPIRDRILVRDMVFGDRLTTGGILMIGDDRKSEGIRPRWAEVHAVGPEQKDIAVGEWILVSHGRWTRGMKYNIAGEDLTVRMVDNADILLVSTEAMEDETVSVALTAHSDAHRIEGSLHNDGTDRDAIAK